MPNMTYDRPTDLVRLRLAAALTHQLRAVALTVWPAAGPSVVVARDSCHHPDLSACTLRNLVRAALQGETTPVGLRWMFEVADLTVDGVGVRHLGDGVVSVEHGEAQGRWWPTLLDADRLTTVLGDAAAGVLEDGLADPGIVAAAEVAAHVDPELGVTVVQLRLPPGPVVHDRCCDEVARALSRACVISELLEGAGSGTRT